MTAPESDCPHPPDPPAEPASAAAGVIVHRFAPGLAAGAAAAMVPHGVRMLAERRAASRPAPDRVCWCRISYRQHFRPPAALREIRHADGTRTHELTVDLGQVVSPADLQRCFAEALDGPRRAPGVDIGRFGPVGASPIWEFNAAFWNHMPGYMAAVGRGVRESIGGSPDDGQARTREHARRFGTLLAAAAGLSRHLAFACRPRQGAHDDSGSGPRRARTSAARRSARYGATVI